MQWMEILDAEWLFLLRCGIGDCKGRGANDTTNNEKGFCVKISSREEFVVFDLDCGVTA